MKQNKKIAITHYISIRFSAIIFIMAAIMILFISYFSNKTIYFDIRRQIRKETHYDFLNIDIRNGKIFVNKNFIFEEDHVQKIILDSQGDFFRGHYPDKKLKNIPVNQWHFQKVKCSSDKIGTDGDLAKRIEYTTPFKELDAMIQANNRMMDRLEDLFQQQQQFTSDVAHELRTPSAIVSAECQYLKKYGKNIDDYTESLTVIERQNTKTTEIISQLLQLSRLEQGRIKDDFEYSNFKTLIESVCDMEPLQFKKQITIYSNLDDISIYMNVGLMAIAVKNIINNAMKYSKNKSSIKLKLWKEKDYVFFEVKDYGCGMSEETKKHIYDRFYRADKSRNTEGFGLGLSLVHKIIELHKGTIRVQSELGVGSIFTLSLPSDKSSQ